MNQILTVAEVIAPILAAVLLGVLAKRRKMLTNTEIRGLQQFVMKFGLPCVLFNSCLTADIGAESLSTMAMVLPFVIVATLMSFHLRSRYFHFHNLPMQFAAQETGMLGIPLFIILFGADQAYRMGILDLTQMVTAYPVIAILSADIGKNPSLKSILKGVFTSTLLIVSLTGLMLNLTGIGSWLDSIGIGGVLTACTGFLAQPVSAIMIFCVGFNFSLDRSHRGTIFRISLVHFLMFALFGLAIQAGLCLIPNTDPMTRWAIVMYSTLPASYLAPSLGRSEEDYTVASGVCSLLTVASLLVFCVIAALAG